MLGIPYSYSLGLKSWLINTVVSNFPSVRFRRWALTKIGGAKIDANVRIYNGFHIRHPLGLSIAEGVSIGNNVLLDGRLGLTICENAVLGYGCIIWTMNHDYNDVHFKEVGGPVVIGKRAWICSNSIILPNITIGEGAVVASGAVVTKDVAPYTVVAGIPAKKIAERDKKDYTYGYNRKNEYMHFS